MSKRRVKPDELDLWQQVAKTTERLSPVKQNDFKRMIETPDYVDVPRDASASTPAPVPEFRVGQRSKSKASSSALPPSVSERLTNDPVNMDHKAFTRLKRGKLKPEGRIDLHGMTLDQAHPALLRFIMSSQSQGRRLVLVITGKGQRDDPHSPIPRRRGVLKQQVPQWLRMAPVAQAVLQVSEAHIRHGGEGAYYVYLRRNR